MCIRDSLNARGPQFYWGIGDIATKEVIDDLDQRFGIDRQRVYITGGSMGGTGAYRQGIAHPERIAAAVGVDGWTDFGEWHWHWYSRKDQPDDIEEFRRPLLEAASPPYWADRALWGDVYIIADAQDNVVYPWQASDLVRYGLTATVASYESADVLSESAALLGRKAKVHIKVDTGMGRLGLPPDAISGLVRHVSGLPRLEIEGIFTHLACAESDPSMTRRQLELSLIHI